MQCDIHQFAFNFNNNIHCVLNYFKVDSLISTTFLSMNRFLFFRNGDPLDRSGFRLCKNVCEVEFSQRKNKSKKLAGNGSSPSKREAPVRLRELDHSFVLQHRCPRIDAFFVSAFPVQSEGGSAGSAPPQDPLRTETALLFLCASDCAPRGKSPFLSGNELTFWWIKNRESART